MANWTERDGAAGDTDWLAIGLFFTVACLWSLVAVRWSSLDIPGTIFGLKIDDALLVGFGPAVATVACSFVRPSASPRTISFLGRVPWATWLAMAAPIITAMAFGYPKSEVPWLAGLAFALSVLIYCVGEEIGWRCWMFDALAGLKLWQSTLVTAALWCAWHRTFLDQLRSDPAFAAQFALFILLGSAGLAQVTRRTRSIGIAAAIHAALKVLLLPAQIALMVLLMAVAIWRGGLQDKTKQELAA